MKRKEIALWYINISKSTLLGAAAVLTGINILYAILTHATASHVRVNGADFVIYIITVVLTLLNSLAVLRFGLINGVSRKSIFIGSTIGTALLSLITGLMCSIFSYSFYLAGSRELAQSSVLTMFLSPVLNGSLIADAFTLFINNALLCFLLSACSIFIALVFFRLKGPWKSVWAAGVPITIFVLVPLILGLMPESALASMMQIANRFFQFLLSGRFHLALVTFIASIPIFIFDWLFVRKAPLD